MSARTWALVSDELMESDPPWDDAGLHVIEPGPYEHPGMRWWKFTDDGAPETLDGKRVDYVFDAIPDGPPWLRVSGRRPAL